MLVVVVVKACTLSPKRITVTTHYNPLHQGNAPARVHVLKCKRHYSEWTRATETWSFLNPPAKVPCNFKRAPDSWASTQSFLCPSPAADKEQQHVRCAHKWESTDGAMSPASLPYQGKQGEGVLSPHHGTAFIHPAREQLLARWRSSSPNPSHTRNRELVSTSPARTQTGTRTP